MHVVDIVVVLAEAPTDNRGLRVPSLYYNALQCFVLCSAVTVPEDCLELRRGEVNEQPCFLNGEHVRKLTER